MNKFMLCLLMTLLSFALVVQDASARRFGGGRSFGVQRSHSSLFSSAPVKPFKSFNQQSTKRWGGFLGGLLMGGLLASLFMSNGFAAGMFSWLLIGGLIFLVLHLLRRKTAPAYSYQHNRTATAYSSAEPFKPYVPNNNYSGSVENFDELSFLREAKICFYRLQAAYDQKNKEDLQTLTTPEVFAEINMQIEARGDKPSTTEFKNLEAELLNVEHQTQSRIASVRFSGYVKEDENPMVAFEEIWHFNQFNNEPLWIVSGIQQEVPQV